ELELLLFVVTTFQRVADVHRRVGGEESGRGRAQALVIRLVEYGVAAVTGGEFGPVDEFEAVELLTPPVSVLEVFDEFFGVGTQVLHDTFVLGVVEGDVDPQRRVEGPVLVVLLGVGGLLGAARQDAFDPFQVAFLRVLVLVDVFVVVQVLTLDPGTLGVREVVDDVVEQLTTGRQRGVGATAEEVPHHQATRDEKDDHGDGDADEEGAYTRVPRRNGWARRTGHAWSRWSAGRTGRTGRWWGEPGPTRRHVLSTRLLRTVPAVLALGLPRLSPYVVTGPVGLPGLGDVGGPITRSAGERLLTGAPWECSVIKGISAHRCRGRETPRCSTGAALRPHLLTGLVVTRYFTGAPPRRRTPERHP